MIIELGPGAGVACARMSKIAEELNKEVVIDTIGLTPVAPRFRLLLNHMQLERLADEYIRQGDKEIKRLKKHRKMDRHALSLELAFALHNKSGTVFDVPEKPFIRHQYIGDFREVVNVNKYDFIYEEWGAFWHVLNIKDNSKQAFDKVMALLDKNGIFYFNGLRLTKWDKIRDLPGNLIFVTWPDDILVVHKDGIYGRKLMSGNTEAEKVSENVYRFDSFKKMFKMLKGESASNRAGIEQKSRKRALQSI